MSHHAQTIQAYTDECDRRGIQWYRPDPSHRCTAGTCRLVEITCTQPRFPVFVCTSATIVHDCGEACGRMLQSDEGFACELTGLCRKDAPLVYYQAYEKDFLGQSKPIGAPIAMGHRARRKRVSTVPVSSCAGVIAQTVRMILCGQERGRVYKLRRQRVVNDVVSILSKQYRNTRSLVCLNRVVRRYLHKQGKYLNPPANESNADDAIRKYSGLIATYYQKYHKHAQQRGIPFGPGRRHAIVFTACVCLYLGTGYVINKTQVIPPVSIFQRHIPADTQFKAVCNVTCRAMSGMNRQMRKVCVGPSGNVLRELVFE